MTDTRRPARFAATRLDLDVLGEAAEGASPGGSTGGSIWRVSGAATLAAGAVRTPIDGRFDTATERFTIDAGPARIAFEPGGLQPADISPAFGAGYLAGGAATIDARFASAAGGGLTSRATATLDGVSLQTGAFALEGVDGRLAFASLAPLATDGVQSAVARSIVAGVPLSDPEARFSIVSRRGDPSLRLERFTGGLAGGTVAIEDAAIPLDGGAFDLDVALRSIDFATLVDEWSISGLDGEGRFSGVVPVSVGENEVTIADGAIAADGPGVMRVDWGEARNALIGAGDLPVVWMVNLLENFEFSTLSVGLNRPVAGELALDARMIGGNPEYGDVRDHTINIGLEGDLEKILAAVSEGRRLGSDLIRSGLTR